MDPCPPPAGLRPATESPTTVQRELEFLRQIPGHGQGDGVQFDAQFIGALDPLFQFARSISGDRVEAVVEVLNIIGPHLPNAATQAQPEAAIILTPYPCRLDRHRGPDGTASHHFNRCSLDRLRGAVAPGPQGKLQFRPGPGGHAAPGVRGPASFLHIQVQPQRDAVHRDRVPGRRLGSMDAPPEQQENQADMPAQPSNQPAAFRDHLRRAG